MKSTLVKPCCLPAHAFAEVSCMHRRHSQSPPSQPALPPCSWFGPPPLPAKQRGGWRRICQGEPSKGEPRSSFHFLCREILFHHKVQFDRELRSGKWSPGTRKVSLLGLACVCVCVYSLEPSLTAEAELRLAFAKRVLLLCHGRLVDVAPFLTVLRAASSTQPPNPARHPLWPIGKWKNEESSSDPRLCPGLQGRRPGKPSLKSLNRILGSTLLLDPSPPYEGRVVAVVESQTWELACGGGFSDVAIQWMGSDCTVSPSSLPLQVVLPPSQQSTWLKTASVDVTES